MIYFLSKKIKEASEDLGYLIQLELDYKRITPKGDRDYKYLRKLYQSQNRLEGFINKMIRKMPYVG